jgi:eukaryotic-like serine/threonine-protein kinase
MPVASNGFGGGAWKFPLALIAGRYELVRKLGAGGMGAVYLARMAGLGKPINPFSAAMHAAMQSRMNPRKSFDRAFESSTQKPTRARAEDVTDVEAKDIC